MTFLLCSISVFDIVLVVILYFAVLICDIIDVYIWLLAIFIVYINRLILLLHQNDTA